MYCPEQPNLLLRNYRRDNPHHVHGKRWPCFQSFDAALPIRALTEGSNCIEEYEKAQSNKAISPDVKSQS